MNKNISLLAIISFAVFLSQGNAAFAAITSEEVVSLVNQDRTEAGLVPLIRSSVLDRAAEGKAGDMATEQYFSHTSPKGITPWDWFRQSEYEYRYAGENLAIHFRDAVLEEQVWMESKRHCENILSPKYREIGVAIRSINWEGRQTTVAVQMFGTQMIDEKKIDLSQKSRVNCPKKYPSVLGSSMPADNNGGVIGAVTNFLSTTATHWKIDTKRLLALIFFAFVQASGLFVVLSFAMHEKWLRKW